MIKTKYKLIGLSFLFLFIISTIYSINVNAEIINGVNNVNQDDKLYVDTPNNFNTMFHNDSNIKETFDNSSIEFINLQNTSVIDTTYLELPNNYENAGLGNMLLNSTEITNQENMNPEVLGDFPATYSFENEVGLTNLNIGYVDGLDGSIGGSEIISSFNNHSTVLRMTDNTPATYVIKNNFAGQEYGNIRFWILSNDTTKTFYWYFRYASTQAMYLTMINSQFITYDGSNWHQTGIYTSNNIWSYHSIIFNCSSDTFDWFINGVNAGNYPFRTNVDIISNLALATYSITGDFCVYYDAIQYSWMPYNDNRYSLPIDMINGTFDNSNNMSINDDNYSEFNSTVGFNIGNDYLIDSINKVS